jgi:hypothetical protein
MTVQVISVLLGFVAFGLLVFFWTKNYYYKQGLDGIEQRSFKLGKETADGFQQIEFDHGAEYLHETLGITDQRANQLRSIAKEIVQESTAGGMKVSRIIERILKGPRQANEKLFLIYFVISVADEITEVKESEQ